MKRILLAVLLGVFLFVGCVVGPGPRGSGVVVVPALPSIVVLEAGALLLPGRLSLSLPERPLVLLERKERTLGGTAKGPLPERGQVQGQGDERGG